MTTLLDTRLKAMTHLRRLLCEGAPPHTVKRAIDDNVWFTPDDIKYAIDAITDTMLSHDAVTQWLGRYPHADKGRRVAVIMAGNIPMAGFFDLLCCCLTGNTALVKHSSKDRHLMQWAQECVRTAFDADIRELREHTEAEALIASGSTNTAMHIRRQFGSIPMILRGHRSSAAIIEGNETERELALLWNDIFTYHTLGCRNVTHLYLPDGYPAAAIAEALSCQSHRMTHPPFIDNYRQNRALKIMTGAPFIDGGFFTLSPGNRSDAISDITYSFYRSSQELSDTLAAAEHHTQCLVSHRHIPFGSAQQPYPWDYPDSVDVIDFLLKP
ncbi:MAG: hypothetical protein K2N86_00535 [Rikenellaceae bacterium]|nr:hypothetical protein [Rikenellaceae bacterium]